MFSLRKMIAMATLLVALLLSQSSTNAFAPVSSVSSQTTRADTKLFFFGGPKDDGSPGDYVCLDCGWVFTKGPKAWADLPDNFSCPPCGSVKRRFKKVPKGSAGKGK
ncbi:expressed unknown protein [Seminavis robusta]|uniref:Rubredoxin-like domain-containing protein n=1 Tax=Seminavis robusta TaxID=568900 RepID=A0A9N8HK57_9STRA|nr:expressed unknown protein [Seminavis robusta]|eukprot:Sro812_g206020.1 n/a (107) ;mRNA; f:8105-8534